MRTPTLLRNGLIFCSRPEPAGLAPGEGGAGETPRLSRKDLLIEAGRIAAIGERLSHPTADIVDLDGLILCPGFADMHVHLREPGYEVKETIASGTAAAAAGGFTTVCAMPNLSPVPDSAETLAISLDRIGQSAHIRVLPYGAITRAQLGQEPADLEAMAPHCIGFSDDGRGVQDSRVMREAMERIAALGKLLSAHCEDDSLKTPGGCMHDGPASRRYGVAGLSSAVEWKQLERDLDLVARTNVRYHVCHISAKESVALIRQAKRSGLQVTCECTPHQLMFCDDDITEDHGRFKMNPPLRGRADREAILEGLLDGVIDCIATDHAPHTEAEKSGGLRQSAFGIVGLETAFAACHTALVLPGHASLSFLLERMITAPARILGLDCGLAVGAPADLTALDPNAQWTVDPTAFLGKGKSTPFAGRLLTGRVFHTWFQGRQVYHGGDCQCTKRGS